MSAARLVGGALYIAALLGWNWVCSKHYEVQLQNAATQVRRPAGETITVHGAPTAVPTAAVLAMSVTGQQPATQVKPTPQATPGPEGRTQAARERTSRRTERCKVNLSSLTGCAYSR